MEWVVMLLLAVVLMLWWIRAAIEPIREYFHQKNGDREDRIAEIREQVADKERAYNHFLAGSTPERAAAMMEVSKKMESRDHRSGPKKPGPD